MELEPTTEAGKRLKELLENWLEISPESGLDLIKRAFLMYSTKITHEDSFLVSLYGQNALDQTPLCLSKQLKTASLRIQHGIEVSLDKKCVKQLIVAMEWSRNGKVLTEILKWAEGAILKEDEPCEDANVPTDEEVSVTSTASAPFVAPEEGTELGPRALNSLFSDPAFDVSKRRDRQIQLGISGEVQINAVEISGQLILVGLSNGEIQVYSSIDLECQTVLKYDEDSGIRGLQCTLAQIIGAYEDNNIGIWDLQSKNLVQKFPVGGQRPDGLHFFTENVTCMRWRKPVLIVWEDYGLGAIERQQQFLQNPP